MWRLQIVFVFLARTKRKEPNSVRGETLMDQIKIYGTSWCPDCAKAKQVFTKFKIPFEWIDIDQNQNAAAYVEKINGGFKSVPTIVFPDNSVLVEPSSADLEKKLQSLTKRRLEQR